MTARPTALFFRAETAYAICGLLLTCTLLRHGWSPFDDGWYGWLARRMSEGAVLHNDLPVWHPGYAQYAALWLYDRFGSDPLALRYPLPVLSAILVGAIAWLTRPAGRLVQAVSALAGISLGVVQFISPAASWYAVAVTALAIAVAYAANLAEGRRRTILLIVAGVLLGLCGGFRQFNGVVLAAALVFFQMLAISESGRVPGRFGQCVSFGAWALASVLITAPLLAAFSLWSALLTLPMSLCALFALDRWRRVPTARNPDWLLPVGLGCILGFVPVLIPVFRDGAWSAFVSDTIFAAASHGDYSVGLKLGFGIQLSDAMEAFTLGNAYSFAVGIHLLNIALLPTALASMLYVRRKNLSTYSVALSVMAGACLLNSLAFQGLLYVFFWLPPTCAAIMALTGNMKRASRLAIIFPIAAMALFGLVFHAGRIPGGLWSDFLSRPFANQVDCAIPQCGLRIDATLGNRMHAQYLDLMAHAPSDAPLLLLPSGVNLYVLLPHPAPWSIGYVMDQVTSERQMHRLRAAFDNTPQAVMAVSTSYRPAHPPRALDQWIGTLCLQQETRLHRFYTLCPRTAGNDRPAARATASFSRATSQNRGR